MRISMIFRDRNSFLAFVFREIYNVTSNEDHIRNGSLYRSIITEKNTKVVSSMVFKLSEGSYDRDMFREGGSLEMIFLNNRITNITDNYIIFYYFTSNNNTQLKYYIKNINYCESNKFSYKIG
jgi:hypothetical protein